MRLKFPKLSFLKFGLAQKNSAQPAKRSRAPKTARVSKIDLIGRAENWREASKLLRSPGDVVLVYRGRLRALVLRCPDGCGEDITVNLDASAGPAWRLYQTNNSVTISPSIWRQSGCRSHFTISNNAIRWSGLYNNVDSSLTPSRPTWREQSRQWFEIVSSWIKRQL